MPPTPSAEDDAGVSVGAAAARLGISPSTLRSWERRYAVAASLRTAGGHRRYSLDDLARLDRVRRDIQAGVTPSDAAAAALSGATRQPGEAAPRSSRGTGPGGRVIAVPGAGSAARGLSRAAGQLDLDGAEDLILRALRGDGVLRTWEDMVRPVLVAVGARWAETGDSIEVEHVLSEAVIGALRRRRAELPTPGRRPVLVASAPGDQHTLTLHAVSVGLLERAVPARIIGAQVPVDALVTAMRRIRPGAVFVSCTVSGGVDPEELVAQLPTTRPPTTVVVGGLGWPTELPRELLRAGGLAEAVELLATTA